MVCHLQLGVLTLVMISSLALGQDHADVPKDSAILELDTPRGTLVTLGGTEHGTRTRFEFKDLPGGKWYRSTAEMTFLNGEKTSIPLLMRGGWHVRLPLRPESHSGPQLMIQTGHSGSVESVSVSADGKYALTAATDHAAILWDTQTGRQLRRFAGAHRLATLSRDGQHVLAATVENKAILWDARTGRILQTFQGSTGPVTSVALSGDGRRACTGLGATTVVWDTQTGQKLRTFPVGGWMVALSQDGQRAYSAESLWDTATGKKLQSFTIADSGGRSLAAVLGNNGRLLTAFPNKKAVLWDIQTGQKLQTFSGHRGWVRSGALSSDGRLALTGSDDGTATLWNAQTGQRLHTFTGHRSIGSSCTFGNNGRSLLTGSWDSTAILWDSQTGRQTRTFQGHADPQTLLGLYGDRIITTRVGQLTDSSSKVEAKVLRWSPDGRVEVLDKTSAPLTLHLTLHRAAAETLEVAFMVHKSGQAYQISGYWDRAAYRWLTEQKRKGTPALRGECSGVMSRDGRRVLLGSLNHTATLWDAATRQQLQTFAGHAAEVNATALSQDGRWALTSSLDGTTRLWDAATGQELCQLISLNSGNDWLVVTPEGLFDGSPGGRQKVTFRVGNGLNVVPVDRFFQDFYRPGLLAALWRGERPMPDVQFAAQRPPTLRIVSPKQGGPVEQAQVTLEVEAVDEGGDIKGPWLLHNGARVLASGPPSRQGKILRRSFTVALVEGDNQLEVKAACLDGSWESEPARINFQYARPLERPTLHVVAAGINSYAENRMNLRFARADAQALSELFARRGKLLYRAVQVEQLLDAQVTRSGLRQALAKVAKQARPQDTVILFLAGHGTMVGQRYYFIPHDFKRTDGTLEDDVRAQGLPGDDLGDYLAAVPALKRVLVLDTCNSGGAVGLVKTGRNPFAFRGAIERLTHTQGVFTIAACAASAEAQEVAELGHGVLSYALLAGLRAVDRGPLVNQGLQTDNPERVTHIMEWFTYAAGQVPRLTQRYFGRVQEVEHRSQGQSFPILPVEER